jgi:hypothetical protein
LRRGERGQESPLGVDAVEKVLGPCASNKKYWVLAPAILIQEQQWMRNMIQKFRRPDSIVACRAMAVDFFDSIGLKPTFA